MRFPVKFVKLLRSFFTEHLLVAASGRFIYIILFLEVGSRKFGKGFVCWQFRLRNIPIIIFFIDHIISLFHSQ